MVTLTLAKKDQTCLFAGFSTGSETPWEFTVGRIHVGDQSALRVLEPPYIFGDELPGLFMYEVVLRPNTSI